MAKDKDLYPEKRVKTVGFKVTRSEKIEIEEYCAKKGIDKISVFMRYAVNEAMKKK